VFPPGLPQLIVELRSYFLTVDRTPMAHTLERTSDIVLQKAAGIFNCQDRPVDTDFENADPIGAGRRLNSLILKLEIVNLIRLLKRVNACSCSPSAP